MPRVIVVGGGGAGMAAARCLVTSGVDVVLIEEGEVLGGNCFHVDVPGPDGTTIQIDAGVSDFNRNTFTQLQALLDDLECDLRPIGSSASFMDCDGDTRLFIAPDKFELFVDGNPELLQAEALRFREEAVEALNGETADWTSARYLQQRGYSELFRQVYFNPRAIGCFPMSNDAPENYRMGDVASFWAIHGVIGRPGDRATIDGGMHSYPRLFERWLTDKGGVVFCNARVLGVRRQSHCVDVRVATKTNHLTMRGDAVIVAVPAKAAGYVLEDADTDERVALAAFPSQRSRLVVHSDRALMPRDRDAWAAFNYVVPEGEHPRVRPTITFHPNLLAGLDADIPSVFVTMNPFRQPNAHKIFANRFFIHPVLCPAWSEAVRLLEDVQGKRRTWFCGAYSQAPFVHECALHSGREAALEVLNFLETKSGQSRCDKWTHTADIIDWGTPVVLRADSVEWHGVVEVIGEETLVLRPLHGASLLPSDLKDVELHIGDSCTESLFVFSGTIESSSDTLITVRTADWHTLNRRSHQRFRTGLSARLSWVDAGGTRKTATGRAINLSQSGLRIGLPSEPGPRASVPIIGSNMTIQFEGQEVEWSAAAELVRTVDEVFRSTDVVVEVVCRISVTDQAHPELQKTLQELDRRCTERVRFEVRCTLEHAGGTEEAKTIDIAATGVRLQVASEEVPPVGTKLCVHLPIPGIGTTPIPSKVAWLKRDGPTTMAGLSYIDPDTNISGSLNSFVLFLIRAGFSSVPTT